MIRKECKSLSMMVHLIAAAGNLTDPEWMKDTLLCLQDYVTSEKGGTLPLYATDIKENGGEDLLDKYEKSA
jgi:hypothetical protein